MKLSSAHVSSTFVHAHYHTVKGCVGVCVRIKTEVFFICFAVYLYITSTPLLRLANPLTCEIRRVAKSPIRDGSWCVNVDDHDLIEGIFKLFTLL